MTDILYKKESFKIFGAYMKVQSALDLGFLEAIYQVALEREFIKREIPSQSF
ncbi:MAG: GxxExxY protein [Mariniphaga sp.]